MKTYFKCSTRTKDIQIVIVNDLGEELLILDVDFIKNEERKKLGVVLTLEYSFLGVERAEERCFYEKSDDMTYEFRDIINTDDGDFNLWIDMGSEFYTVEVGEL